MNRRESGQDDSGRSGHICPRCKRAVAADPGDSSGRWKTFPFCSERCKLIDLGAWLDADYRLPVQSDEELDDLRPDVPVPGDALP